MQAKKQVELPVTFKPNKFKFAFFFLVGLMFAVAGVLMIVVTDAKGLGIGFTVFFGLIAAAPFMMLLPNSAYLTLDENGFTFKSLFRVQTIPWSDVAGFSTIRIRRMGYVVWRYTPERRGKGTWTKLNDVFGDYDAMLPDTYGNKAKDLAETMQSALDQWASSQGPVS